MNVYDFDNTLYDGESSFDFFMFCLRRNPKLIKYLGTATTCLVRYKMCRITREDFMELAEKHLIGMMDACPEVLENVPLFWDKHFKRIKSFYSEIHEDDDVVITASFDFLIRPVCEKLAVKNLISSELDFENKKITCYCFREDKPVLFRERFGDVRIDNFYTDSKNDLPLMELADNCYFVKGERITPAKVS